MAMKDGRQVELPGQERDRRVLLEGVALDAVVDDRLRHGERQEVEDLGQYDQAQDDELLVPTVPPNVREQIALHCNPCCRGPSTSFHRLLIRRRPHPEEARRAVSKGGQQQGVCDPCFETLAALAPQHEVVPESSFYENQSLAYPIFDQRVDYIRYLVSGRGGGAVLPIWHSPAQYHRSGQEALRQRGDTSHAHKHPVQACATLQPRLLRSRPCEPLPYHRQSPH